MHLSSSILSTTLCLAASVSALAQKQSRASPGLPPSLDPWYTAPDNLFSYPAGSIIKVRPDPLNLYAAIGTNATSASYNILYRTSDSNQMPSFAVTTLFVPAFRSSKKKNSALLSYQIPYNSPSVDASPSWTLGSQYSSTFGDITAALQQGWYVSVTDFEGPNATFAVGVAEGHAVLDGVRAVTQSPLSPASLSAAAAPPPPPLTNKWSISMWGYSGGSIATEFAAELQSSYAPDIAIAGVAIGGLTTPLLNVVDSVNESPYACLIVLGLWGYANTYPVVESYLLSRLTPEVQASGNFTMGRNMSFEEAVEPYYDVDVYSYFIGGRDDIQSSPLIAYFMSTQGVMGEHGLPGMPMFVYKAINDQLSPVQYSDALIGKYCDAGNAQSEIPGGDGVRIRYERNTIGGHLAEEDNEDGRAFEFLVKAMNGHLGAGWPNGAGQGCVVRNVTVGNDTSPDW